MPGRDINRHCFVMQGRSASTTDQAEAGLSAKKGHPEDTETSDKVSDSIQAFFRASETRTDTRAVLEGTAPQTNDRDLPSNIIRAQARLEEEALAQRKRKHRQARVLGSHPESLVAGEWTLVPEAKAVDLSKQEYDQAVAQGPLARVGRGSTTGQVGMPPTEREEARDLLSQGSDRRQKIRNLFRQSLR